MLTACTDTTLELVELLPASQQNLSLSSMQGCVDLARGSHSTLSRTPVSPCNFQLLLSLMAQKWKHRHPAMAVFGQLFAQMAPVVLGMPQEMNVLCMLLCPVHSCVNTTSVMLARANIEQCLHLFFTLARGKNEVQQHSIDCTQVFLINHLQRCVPV